MPTYTLTYTGTGAEGWDQLLASIPMDAFEGNWIGELTCTPTPTTAGLNLTYAWTNTSTASRCFQGNYSFSAAQPGPYELAGVVGSDPPGQYMCTDWDALQLYTRLSDPVPAGTVLVVSITPVEVTGVGIPAWAALVG